MSEYQYYEFVALDRPLTDQEMAKLRAISTRARITPTHFWNDYQWGDLKSEPLPSCLPVLRKLAKRNRSHHKRL